MSLGNGEAMVNGADRLQTRKNDMQQQKLDIPALAALLEAATPAPWRTYRCQSADYDDQPESACGIDGPPNKHGHDARICYDASYDECHHVMTRADADLIAATRNAAPHLIAIAQAAVAWRDACDDETVSPLDRDEPIIAAEQALIAAIDSALSKPTLADRRKAHGFAELTEDERRDNLDENIAAIDSARGGGGQ